MSTISHGGIIIIKTREIITIILAIFIAAVLGTIIAYCVIDFCWEHKWTKAL